MAKRQGFTEFGSDPFEVAINNVAQQINSFMPKGIGGGKAPKPMPLTRGNQMNTSVKMGGPKSFMDAAWGGMSGQGGGSNLMNRGLPLTRRGFDQLPSVQPRVGLSGGSGGFQTKASNEFWMNTIGEYNTTERLGRQWLEEQAKAKAASSGNPNVSGGNAGNANPDRVAGALQHKDLLMKVAGESGVPWEVLAATMALETGGVNEGTNPAGATGLMQVVGHYADGRPLWQSLADQYGGDLNDPYTNVRTAAEIMKMGYETYGSWEKAAAWYFGGPGAFNDDGSYSMNDDMYGTDIPTYVNVWKDNYAAISGQGGGQGVNHSGQGLVFPIKGYTGGVDLHWGEDPGAADLFADYGTPVLAIQGGVANSGYSEIGGYWTYITGNDGLVYYYAHMDKMGPNGQVNAGDYIAGVSDTGNAAGTGPHLHLGIATAGHGINNGAGPAGGAGDINVADFLNGTYRY